MRLTGLGTAHGAMILSAFAAVMGAEHLSGNPRSQTVTADRQALLEQLPLSFEPVGESGARYLAHGLRGQVEVSAAGVTFRQHSTGSHSAVRMRLAGARSAKRLAGAQPLPGKVNRLYGREAKAWKTGIPTYAQVRQPEVLPGIDMVYYGNQKTLEYDFLVRPGADPSQIRLGFDGSGTRLKAAIEASGDLAIDGGQLRLHKPVVYQEISGQRQTVESAYAVTVNGDVSFHLGDYDRTRALVIDPQLTFSAYVGGEGLDAVSAVATDNAGNIYLTGSTNSPDFAEQASLQPALAGGFDAFVLKAVPVVGGYDLAYSTYIGGGNSDGGSAIAVDTSGYTYVYGVTASADFPTANALGTQLNGTGQEGLLDAFLLKLTSTGSALVYSTYIGGSGDESVPGGASSLAVTGAGQAYVVGNTRSADFPGTSGTYRETLQGGEDIFVGSLAPDGQSGTATLIGGLSSQPEEGLGIAVDSQGNAYVCGDTQNADFPTTAGALRGSFGGEVDAFVTKLRPDLTELVYSTYLGGTSIDQANAIAVDAAGFAYVAGFTGSANYPVTAGAFQSTFHGTAGLDRDACLSKLDRAGMKLVYSTFLGGSSYEIATALRVDRLGAAYVGGFEDGVGFPVAMAIQASNAGSSDCFLTRFLNTGASVSFSTLHGGSLSDRLSGLAVGPDGTCYVGGSTYSTDFPQQNAPGGGGGKPDGFIGRIADAQGTLGKAVVPKSGKAGTVKVGSAKTIKLKIKNTGKEVLYGMVGLTPAPFNVGNGAGSFALAPKKSLTVEVQFAPTVKGSFTGMLPVSTSDVLHAQMSVALSGKGK